MLRIRNLVVTLIVLVLSSFAVPATAGELGKFLGEYGVDVLPGPWVSPNKKQDETPEGRRERIQMIADIVEEQAPIRAEEFGWYWSSDDLAMAAFTKMWYESGRFRLKVHNGMIRGDHGKSVCLGQIMHGGNKLVGTDRESTQRCVVEVMRHLVKHQRRCLNSSTDPSQWAIAKVYVGYGTGYSCNASHRNKENEKWGLQRAQTWWKLRQNMIASLQMQNRIPSRDTENVTTSYHAR